MIINHVRKAQVASVTATPRARHGAAGSWRRIRRYTAPHNIISHARRRGKRNVAEFATHRRRQLAAFCAYATMVSTLLLLYENNTLPANATRCQGDVVVRKRPAPTLIEQAAHIQKVIISTSRWASNACVRHGRQMAVARRTKALKVSPPRKSYAAVRRRAT